MSDINNNIPTRITQLEEATEYEDGMFFAVAKAGRGTYKIPVDEMTPNEQALSDKIENEIVPAVENSFAYGTVDESEIASFQDGSELPLKVLEVAVNPVQDLHGYDGPWPAGGGKNKWEFDSSLSGNGNVLSGKVFTYQIPSGTYTLSCKGTFASGGAMAFRFVYTDDTTKDVTLGYNLQSGTYYASAVFDKAVKALSYVYSNNANNNINSIQLEQGSTATSYAPYENDCPIIGWSAADVIVCGKNLFDKTHYKFVKGGYINGSIEWTGNTTILSYPTDSLGGYWNSPVIDIEPFRGMTLSYSGFVSVSGTVRGIIDKDFNVLATLGTSAVASNTIDLSQYPTAKYLVLTFIASDYNFDNAQLEIGSSATAYEPYNGQTYIIQLGDTYYWCKIDVVSGLLTLLGKMVDLGTYNWIADTGVTGLVRTQDNAIKYMGDIISSQYKGVKNLPLGNMPDGSIQATNVQEYLLLRVRDLRFDGKTAAEVKTMLTGVQMLAELATPLEVQLSPTQIESLKGYNNISADTGNILKVEYIRDLDIVINSLLERIAALEG